MDDEEARLRLVEEAGGGEDSMILAAHLRRLGRNDNALGVLARAEERGHRDARAMIGVILEERGGIDVAITAYRRAARRDSVIASFNLGLLLMQRGDRDGPVTRGRTATGSAMPAARRTSAACSRRAATSRAPRRRIGAAMRAGPNWPRGELAAARDAYERGAERGSAPAAFSLAAVHLRDDDTAAAKVALERARELDHPHAEAMLERIAAEESRPQQVTIGDMIERFNAQRRPETHNLPVIAPLAVGEWRLVTVIHRPDGNRNDIHVLHARPRGRRHDGHRRAGPLRRGHHEHGRVPERGTPLLEEGAQPRGALRRARARRPRGARPPPGVRVWRAPEIEQIIAVLE